MGKITWLHIVRDDEPGSGAVQSPPTPPAVPAVDRLLIDVTDGVYRPTIVAPLADGREALHLSVDRSIITDEDFAELLQYAARFLERVEGRPVDHRPARNRILPPEMN